MHFPLSSAYLTNKILYFDEIQYKKFNKIYFSSLALSENLFWCTKNLSQAAHFWFHCAVHIKSGCDY